MTAALSSVAIVDDDASVLRALSRLLSASGFEACVFHSGREFLESLAEHPVACVLLDIRMPGLDGFEVAGRLAERSSRTPVIFMSAHDDDAHRRRAKEEGACGFLRKPASEKKIMAAIRQALGTGEGDQA